jgi:hypothetical protein
MVDDEILHKWLAEVKGSLYPPGTAIDFVGAHQSSRYQEVLRIGLVCEHRFALFFWAELFASRKNGAMRADQAPLLVSIDSHYDVGNSSLLNECKPDLEKLDFDNRQELGLFCWLRLNPLIDRAMAKGI